MDPAVAKAAQAAAGYLFGQAELGFPDACHRMVFPAYAGFTGASEAQASDLFARAVVGGLLLECAPALGQGAGQALRLAEAQAEHSWAGRHPTALGRFCYFPGLPELPPDADSIAAALRLLVGCGSAHLAQCADLISWLSRSMQAHGQVRTWVVHGKDEPALQERWRWAIERQWGDTYDVGVNLRAMEALLALGEPDLARCGVARLVAEQEPEGAWQASWYYETQGVTAWAVDVLRRLVPEHEAIALGVQALLKAQRADGGWGVGRSEGLPTGQVLQALAPLGQAEAVRRGVACLLDFQRRDGAWNGTPWIKMETGRALGRVGAVAGFGSTAVATAHALRGLVAVLGGELEEAAHE